MTEQNETFDRQAARKVLHSYADEYIATDDEALDALAGCVRPVPPQVIDRETLNGYLGPVLKQWGLAAPQRAAVISGVLDLVRPVPPQTIDRYAVAMELRRFASEVAAGVAPGSLTVANRIAALVVPDSRFDTIRELHDEVEGILNPDTSYCSECNQEWPCATVRALDGDPS